MTMPEPAARRAEMDAPEARGEPSPMSVRLKGVTKIYRLYANPREQVIDSLGLNRFLPWRRRKIFQEFHALKDVDLTVRRGERLGIVGRNGAGKTTLLKLITGNFVPTSGQVEVNGLVQALMQLGTGFHHEFSGYENICAALNYNGLVGEAFEEALADVIDFVELGEFLHQPMKTYSLGMNARVQFAAATAIRPDILIIDEVMGAGDMYFAAKSAARMRDLTSSDCTLLLVSHSTPQILQFCSRAIWLEQGCIVMDGPAAEVIGAYEVDSERRLKEARIDQESNVEETTSLLDQDKVSHKSWIKDKIVAQTLFETDRSADDFKVILANGLPVFRWPSEKGVKINNICLIENGGESGVLHAHRPCEIEINLDVEIDGEISCRYLFAIFNLEAQRLTWIISPIDTFAAKAGDTRRVSASLKPLLLGEGHFVLNAEIFDDTNLVNLTAESRYDLLARCLEFRVVEHGGLQQTAVFRHPADWSFEASETKLRPTTAGNPGSRGSLDGGQDGQGSA